MAEFNLGGRHCYLPLMEIFLPTPPPLKWNLPSNSKNPGHDFELRKNLEKYLHKNIYFFVGKTQFISMD